LILYGTGLLCLVLAATISDEPGGGAIAVGVAIVVILTASAFHHLTVEDRGEYLTIRFGPLPLFRRRVQYDNMVRVETGRTTVLDGWGIHVSLRGGWVWNLWGFDCVVVHLRNGVLRIGTDDPIGLARFLAQKLAERHASASEVSS
jgi:hypothetical protein